MTEQDKKLQLPLLFIRLSVFLVMFMWTIDKFINPGHASKVYESFYYIAGLDVNVMYVIGVIELIILLKFVAGYKKKYTYGAVLALHAVSTLSSFKQYLAPFDGPNLLFFCRLAHVGSLFRIIHFAGSGQEMERRLIARITTVRVRTFGPDALARAT